MASMRTSSNSEMRRDMFWSDLFEHCVESKRVSRLQGVFYKSSLQGTTAEESMFPSVPKRAGTLSKQRARQSRESQECAQACYRTFDPPLPARHAERGWQYAP